MAFESAGNHIITLSTPINLIVDQEVSKRTGFWVFFTHLKTETCLSTNISMRYKKLFGVCYIENIIKLYNISIYALGKCLQ
jgi:hypothetical protein